MAERNQHQAMIQVMVVDDHPVVRQGLATMIGQETDMRVVAEAGSGEEAVTLYRERRPHVTLMDLRLPGIGGVEAITAIRREYPASRFIVLTTYDGDEDICRAFEAGAQGYLLKGMFREVLIEAIRAVNMGLRRVPPEITARLKAHTGRHDLTRRELEILKLIARGLSNREIAAALSIGEGTVKWFVKNILGKLGVNDRTLAVTSALRRGILHLD